jgi:hypothetical protein
MADQKPPSHPLIDEADIGSGEKTPGQIETEEMIRAIPPLPARNGGTPPGGQPAPAKGGQAAPQ